MSPRHMACPSVFAFSYAPDNVCRTTLFPDPVCTLSILEGDSYHDSFHLPLSCDQFCKFGVTKRQSLTAICHYWKYISLNAFLFSLIGTFLSHMILSSLQNAFHACPILLFISCTCSWFFSHHLPEIYISVDPLDLLSIDDHIILVDMLVAHYFPRCIKAYWLADVMDIL